MLADAPLLAAGKSARKLTRSGSQSQQVNTQPVQRKRRRRKNRNKNRGRKRKGIFSLKAYVLFLSKIILQSDISCTVFVWFIGATCIKKVFLFLLQFVF